MFPEDLFSSFCIVIFLRTHIYLLVFFIDTLWDRDFLFVTSISKKISPNRNFFFQLQIKRTNFLLQCERSEQNIQKIPKSNKRTESWCQNYSNKSLINNNYLWNFIMTPSLGIYFIIGNRLRPVSKSVFVFLTKLTKLRFSAVNSFDFQNFPENGEVKKGWFESTSEQFCMKFGVSL